MNLLSRGLSRQQIEEQMEQLRAGSEEQAKQQLKTFFIMDKVAEKLEIEVSEEEINGDIARVAIQRGQRPEKLKEQMERDGSLAQFRLDVRQSKCINKLLETANIAEAAPEEKSGKSKKSKKKPAAEPEQGKASKKVQGAPHTNEQSRRGWWCVHTLYRVAFDKDRLMSAKDDFVRHGDRGRGIYDQYGQYQRFRQMSLDDMLLENRIIFLIGEINYARATEVIMKMLYLDNLKKGREISLYINSPGGRWTTRWRSTTPCGSSARRSPRSASGGPSRAGPWSWRRAPRAAGSLCRMPRSCCTSRGAA
jgi:hypothetical protein